MKSRFETRVLESVKSEKVEGKKMDGSSSVRTNIFHSKPRVSNSKTRMNGGGGCLPTVGVSDLRALVMERNKEGY